MDYLPIIGIVFVTHLLAVMSPGPDFVVVLKNAIQYNRKIAIWTSLGISSGISIHVFYSIAGVAYLIKTNEYIFNIIRYLGALYLIYLGISSIREQHQKLKINQEQNKKTIDYFRALRIGFLTNLLNPKASLFFLSIFSVVIPPKIPNHVLLIISIMLIVVTFIWFCIVSMLFTQNKVIQSYEKHETIFIKAFGVLLIVLGISIALV